MAEGLASESMNDLAGRVQELESALQEAQSARAAAEERLWEQQEELSRLQVGSRVMLGYDKHERMHTDFLLTTQVGVIRPDPFMATRIIRVGSCAWI